jgi:hypothetical protein
MIFRDISKDSTLFRISIFAFRIFLPGVISSSWAGLAADEVHTGLEVLLTKSERWSSMPETTPVAAGNLDPAQAKELAVVVELEARWENLRASSQSSKNPPTIHDLHAKQKAYEAFRLKLAAYNKRFAPAHIPELLLNTGARLGTWCRTMRKLYQQLEHDAQTQCPVSLLEKAYRWADLVAGKEHKPHIERSAPPATIGAAIRELEALSHWCAELAKIAPAA